MGTLSSTKRLVVKIGSSLLVGEAGLRGDWLHALALDVAEITARGTDVILVSSGSIALGRVAQSNQVANAHDGLAIATTSMGKNDAT